MNDVVEVGAGAALAPHIKYFPDLIQGSDEWLAARCGLLTASEMKLIVAPPPKVEARIKKNGEPYKQREQSPAENAARRAHIYELASQRVMRHVEPGYVGYDMLRGQDDEVEARILYNKHYAPVSDMGFITNNRWGFTLGYSPDGLVGDHGAIECKSRVQKLQFKTIVENVINEVDGAYEVGDTIPDEFILQIQTGLLVSEREWCDFVTYSNGMHMATIRVWPDATIQEAIIKAASAFEEAVAERIARYHAALKSKARLIPTERRIIQEMYA